MNALTSSSGPDTGLFASAARLWSEAIQADLRLADDRRARHRYDTACSAALAAAGDLDRLAADTPEEVVIRTGSGL